MATIAKRKVEAQDEFARLFAKREQIIFALVRIESKLKDSRRRLARLSKADAKARSAPDHYPGLNDSPDLTSPKHEIPGFVRKDETLGESCDRIVSEMLQS